MTISPALVSKRTDMVVANTSKSVAGRVEVADWNSKGDLEIHGYFALVVPGSVTTPVRPTSIERETRRSAELRFRSRD